MKKIEILTLGLILIVGILLRFPLVAQGFFAFTYDQGRDITKVAEIVEMHRPTLIGPTTGLPGIFYGPWWYYYLSPIFLISSGDPTKIALSFAVLGTITIVLVYLLVKSLTKNITVALFAAATAANSQPFLTASAQIWSPSLVLTLMIAYVFLLSKIFKKSQALTLLALGLVCALILDSGAAFGVMLSLSTVLTFLIFRKTFLNKNLLYFFAGFLIILSPRIA